MRIPTDGSALYQVESNRSGNRGPKAVSESAAVGAGFPDALPKQRAARDKAADIEKEHRKRGQQGSGEQQLQEDRRKEKQRVPIDRRSRRPMYLANGTLIDVKI